MEHRNLHPTWPRVSRALVVAFGVVAVASAEARAQAPAVAKLPSTGEVWQIIPLPQSSLVYARDGSLIGEIGKQWRTSVSLAFSEQKPNDFCRRTGFRSRRTQDAV